MAALKLPDQPVDSSYTGPWEAPPDASSNPPPEPHPSRTPRPRVCHDLQQRSECDRWFLHATGQCGLRGLNRNLAFYDNIDI